MNALIDLNSCKEYMTIKLNDKSFNVKLAGTIKNPYFCGRDICDVLDHKDFKYALKTHVPLKYKTELSNFYGENNQDLRGGFPPPQTMVNHNQKLGKNQITFREGQMVYVSEPGLYSLIMNSKTMFATMFQELVYETILPNIREYGSYQVENELSQAMARLAITEGELKNEVEQRQKVEIEAKEKLQRALKFNQATKQVEPQEYIYIATTDQYMPENKFKPGGCGTFDLVKSRLSQYNSGKSDSNGHFFVYLRKVVSYRAVEQALYATLGGFRENSNKELYIINFNWLVKCIDAIIDHNMEFLLFVNLNREQMVEDTMNKEPIIMAPLHLEKIRISYQRIGEEEVELTTILEQDTINAIKESLITFNPDNNIIKRIVFENHLKQNYPEVKIDHKKRIVWDIVKKLGTMVNPRWRYKY